MKLLFSFFCLAPISEVIFPKEEYKLQGEDLQMKGTNYSGIVERKANGQPNTRLQ